MEEQIKPQNQKDVNPGTQQDHIQELKSKELQNSDEDEIGQKERIPETNGTGSNNPVATPSSLIIEGDDDKS